RLIVVGNRAVDVFLAGILNATIGIKYRKSLALKLSGFDRILTCGDGNIARRIFASLSVVCRSKSAKGQKHQKCNEGSCCTCRRPHIRLLSRPVLNNFIKPLRGRHHGFGWCPRWVKSRHVRCKTACPLYPRKRTYAAQLATSALGR